MWALVVISLALCFDVEWEWLSNETVTVEVQCWGCSEWGWLSNETVTVEVQCWGCSDFHMLVTSCAHVPYSGKISRGAIFVDVRV